MTSNRVSPGAKRPAERSDVGANVAPRDVELLADAACHALIGYRAAEQEAADATERARVLRDDAILELSEAGWSVRRIAAELDLSSARVGQLLIRARERRTAEWGDYTLPAGAVAADRLDAFHTARDAQVMREEAYSGGGREERAAFYGRLDAPAVAEAEQPITWRAFLVDAGRADER